MADLTSHITTSEIRADVLRAWQPGAIQEAKIASWDDYTPEQKKDLELTLRVTQILMQKPAKVTPWWSRLFRRRPG